VARVQFLERLLGVFIWNSLDFLSVGISAFLRGLKCMEYENDLTHSPAYALTSVLLEDDLLLGRYIM
jgi:hypothetical protein